MDRTKSDYFLNVDLLRGFAALSVLVYHVIEIRHWVDFPTSGPLLWFRAGWMGVDLFFVISGFVISLSAFAGINRNSNGSFRSRFFNRRIRRIVPLHYLTLLVVVVFVNPGLLFEKPLPNIFSHLLFVHNLFPQWHSAINGPNWSLAVEMQFYVLVAIIAPWLRLANPWTIMIAMIGVSWSWRFAATSYLGVAPETEPHKLFLVTTQLPGMLDEFAIGIGLARLVSSTYWPRMARVFSLPIPAFGLAALVSALLFMAFSVYWPNAGYWDSVWMVTFFRTLLGLAFGGVVLFVCVVTFPPIVNALLAPLRYLGRISFGIYLWHLPVLLSLGEIGWLSPIKALAYATLLTLVLAAASWHTFEMQFLTKRGEGKL
jgi:peptidoglycan/LPS O-acetylase OafA/YrhL